MGNSRVNKDISQQELEKIRKQWYKQLDGEKGFKVPLICFPNEVMLDKPPTSFYKICEAFDLMHKTEGNSNE